MMGRARCRPKQLGLPFPCLLSSIIYLVSGITPMSSRLTPPKSPTPTSFIPFPRTRTPDYSRRDGCRWHAHQCRYMVIDTMHWPRRSRARSLEILGWSAQPSSAQWPIGFPTASACTLTTQTQITTPQHHTVNNPRCSDARCNDIALDQCPNLL